MKQRRETPVTISGRTYSLKTRYAAMSLAMTLQEAGRDIYLAAHAENWAKLVRLVMEATLALRELSKAGHDELSEQGNLQRMAENAAGGSQRSWDDIQAEWQTPAEKPRKGSKAESINQASANHSRVYGL